MSDPAAARVPAPRWAWLVATGFGSGYLRPAPGTWGSLAALLVWLGFTAGVAAPARTWALRHAGEGTFQAVQAGLELLYLVLPAAMTWLAVVASDRVVAETGDKDPSWIVADEWAGMFIAMWPVRLLLAGNLHRLGLPGGWRFAALALLPFLWFRVLDILKPWPCRQIQALPGGQGIVADDVVAGLYAIPLTLALVPLLLAR